MKKELVYYACIAFLILIFTYTAASKFLDHHKFVFQMSMSPFLFLKTIAPSLGFAIPLAEAVIVFLLIRKSGRLIGLWLSFSLLIVFEIYIITMLLSGLDLPCSCGGIINTLSWKQHVIFNAALIAANVYSIFKFQQIDSPQIK